MAEYPAARPSLPDVQDYTGTDPANAPAAAKLTAAKWTQLRDELLAVIDELGLDPAGASATVKARLDALAGTYAPLVHGHAQSDVTGLTAALAAKADGSATAAALAGKADLAGGTAVALTQGGTGATSASGARTNLGLGGAATRNVGTTSADVAAGDAPANVLATATLAEYFGLSNGAPISPWQPEPVGTVEYWALANFQSGAGYNSTTLTPSITGNSTQYTLKTRVAVGSLFANIDTGMRLEFDYAKTVPSGWWAISVAVTDNAAAVLAGTARQYLVSDQSPRQNGHMVFDFQPQVSAGASTYVEVMLEIYNNAPSGAVTLTNVSLRSTGRLSRPMLISKEYNTGNFPLMYWPQQDINTGQWKMSEHTTFTDGSLTPSFRDFVGMTSDQPFQHQQPDPLMVKTGGSRSTQIGFQRILSYPTGSQTIRTQNNDQIIEVLNGSSALELRCNVHGGEYADTGVSYSVDRGSGTFEPWTLSHGLDPVRRVQMNLPTFVCMTTAPAQTKPNAFATVDHLFTYFPDGMVRCDRTTTFQQTVTLGGYFEWMSSHINTVPALGRIGRGLTVLGEIDTHNKVTAPTLTPSTSTTGGTLAAATYSYTITAITPYGESTPATAVTQVTTGTTSTVTLTWSTATNATGYRIYGRTAGVERLITTLGPAATTWTDDGSGIPGTVAPPTVNTGRYYPGTANANDAEASTNVTWAAFYEPRSGWVIGNIYDRDTVLARSGVASVRTRIEMAPGIQKIYNNVAWTAGATRSVSAGTAWSATHWTFHYLPRKADQWHEEIAVRAANINALKSLYPST